MKNTVRQSHNQSLIQMGDWYLGIYIDDNDNLLIHIDNGNGVVKSANTENYYADDEYQWAEVFYVEPVRKSKRIWTKVVPRRTVRVEVTE